MQWWRYGGCSGKFQGNYGDTGERHMTQFPPNTRVEEKVRNIELSQLFLLACIVT